MWIMMAGYRCTILVADAPGAASALLSKKPETATMNLLQRHMSGEFCMDYLSYLTWVGGVPVHSCKTRDTNAVAPAGGDKGIRMTKTLQEKNGIYHRSDQLRESCALAVNGNDESASTGAQLEPNVSYLNPKIP